MLGTGSRPPIEPVLTMCPPSALRSRIGRNVVTPWITPQRFTLISHRQSSRVAVRVGPAGPTPALLQTTCTAPKRSSVSSASALDARGVAHVGEDADGAELGGGSREGGRLDVGEHDLHALADQGAGDAPADTGGAAGDHGDLAAQLGNAAQPLVRRPELPACAASPASWPARCPTRCATHGGWPAGSRCRLPPRAPSRGRAAG